MSTEKPEDEGLEDTEITCWCGAKGTYEELFSDDLDETCGGSGVLYCYCGGDLCVCHHHGETDCPGCDECQDEDGVDDYDWSDDDDRHEDGE